MSGRAGYAIHDGGNKKKKKNTSCGVQLRIRGKVQGVGFRPFVWQLAQQLNLHGDVCNDGDGVEVRCGKTRKRFLFNCISTAAAGAY